MGRFCHPRTRRARRELPPCRVRSATRGGGCQFSQWRGATSYVVCGALLALAEGAVEGGAEGRACVRHHVSAALEVTDVAAQVVHVGRALRLHVRVGVLRHHVHGAGAVLCQVVVRVGVGRHVQRVRLLRLRLRAVLRAEVALGLPQVRRHGGALVLRHRALRQRALRAMTGDGRALEVQRELGWAVHLPPPPLPNGLRQQDSRRSLFARGSACLRAASGGSRAWRASGAWVAVHFVRVRNILGAGLCSAA